MESIDDNTYYEVRMCTLEQAEAEIHDFVPAMLAHTLVLYCVSMDAEWFIDNLLGKWIYGRS